MEKTYVTSSTKETTSTSVGAKGILQQSLVFFRPALENIGEKSFVVMDGASDRSDKKLEKESKSRK